MSVGLRDGHAIANVLSHDEIYLQSFVSKYLPLFPDEIILEIARLVSIEHLIQFLVFLEGFKPLIYQEFFKDLNVDSWGGNLDVMVPSWWSHDAYRALETKYPISQFPPHLSPRSIYLSADSTDALQSFLDCYGNTILKTTNDIQVSLCMRSDFYVNDKHKDGLIQLINTPKLSNLRLTCKAKNAQLVIEVAIDSNQLISYYPFINTLMNVESLNVATFIAQLPITTHSLTILPIFLHYPLVVDHLQHLKVLAIYGTHIGQLTNLPTSLEEFSICQSKFEVEDQNYSWPPNLKRIDISSSSVNDDTLIKLSHWPQDLKCLSLRNCVFSNFSSVGTLPDGLETLEIYTTDRLGISYDLDEDKSSSMNILPYSLIRINLSQINFFSSYIEFPPNVQDLTLDACANMSLEKLHFPRSLTHLYLRSNEIRELKSYNNYTSSYKNWCQLDNLQVLQLSDNLLTSKELRNWIPPPNLKHIDLGLNHRISNLRISVFNPLLKEFTKRLTIIDLHFCNIKKIPQDFYVPVNVNALNLSHNDITHISLPVSITTHKKLTHLYLDENKFTTLDFDSHEGGHIQSSVLEFLDVASVYMANADPEAIFTAVETAFGRKVLDKVPLGLEAIRLGRLDST